MTIEITRLELDAAGLRAAARGVDGTGAPRLIAVALVLEGHSRTDAARMAGMDRRTLRDWVDRYNAAGVAGMSDRHGGGVAPKLTDAEHAMQADWCAKVPTLRNTA